MIKTRCGHCGAFHEVLDHWNGKQTRCPKCRQVFIVGATSAQEHGPVAGKTASSGGAAALRKPAATSDLQSVVAEMDLSVGGDTPGYTPSGRIRSGALLAAVTAAGGIVAPVVAQIGVFIGLGMGAACVVPLRRVANAGFIEGRTAVNIGLWLSWIGLILIGAIGSGILVYYSQKMVRNRNPRYGILAGLAIGIACVLATSLLHDPVYGHHNNLDKAYTRWGTLTGSSPDPAPSKLGAVVLSFVLDFTQEEGTILFGPAMRWAPGPGSMSNLLGWSKFGFVIFLIALVVGAIVAGLMGAKIPFCEGCQTYPSTHSRLRWHNVGHEEFRQLVASGALAKLAEHGKDSQTKDPKPFEMTVKTCSCGGMTAICIWSERGGLSHTIVPNPQTLPKWRSIMHTGQDHSIWR